MPTTAVNVREQPIVLSDAKPIAFAPAMVAAIVAGRKSQTRRPVKPQPTLPYVKTVLHWKGGVGALFTDREPLNGSTGVTAWCPYGKPGDVRYVKERWRYEITDGVGGLRYQSDGSFAPAPFRVHREIASSSVRTAQKKSGKDFTPWHVHLPKWAARMFIRIEGVRVERLQAISERDAIDEGLWLNGFAAGVCHPHAQENCRRCGYAILWDSHNRASGFTWADNPFVWAITFARVPA